MNARPSHEPPGGDLEQDDGSAGAQPPGSRTQARPRVPAEPAKASPATASDPGSREQACGDGDHATTGEHHATYEPL